MKTYEEMAHDALGRINDHTAVQKQRRKAINKTAVPVASFCLIAIFGLCIWRTGSFPRTANTSKSTDITANNGGISNSAPATDFDETNTVEAANKEDASGLTSNYCCIFWWKNKINVSGTLYQALNNDPEGTFTVVASYRPTADNITSFTYEGKSMSEWAKEAADEEMIVSRMTTLLKLGDSLKYGTALYQGGAPSGEKWDKAYYEETVSEIGEDLIKKYIVNGDFLSEKLEKDIITQENTVVDATGKYQQAYYTYLKSAVSSALKRLEKNNIKCERNTDTNYGLTITVTAQKLENLPLDDLGSWFFGLPSDYKYKKDVTGADVVNEAFASQT